MTCLYILTNFYVKNIIVPIQLFVPSMIMFKHIKIIL